MVLCPLIKYCLFCPQSLKKSSSPTSGAFLEVLEVGRLNFLFESIRKFFIDDDFTNYGPNESDEEKRRSAKIQYHEPRLRVSKGSYVGLAIKENDARDSDMRR